MLNEKEILKFWDENKIFEKSLAQRVKKPLFSFYDGPPFANGLPHYGHILANVIKDAVTRFWTMRGFGVARRVGWDTHGLPVEIEVEKQLNLKGKKDIEKFGIEKFNDACQASVFHYKKEWENTLKRVGRWADYSQAYATLDNSYMESVWWVFKKLWDQNLIYKGFRVTPYCPRCGTPLSNFEVNQGYKEVEDTSIYLKFPLKNKKNTYFLVWTTTPWTLPANLALAVGQKIDYVQIKTKNGENYILAEARLKVLKEPYEIIKHFKADDLTGLKYQPLFELSKDKNVYRVISGDFVSVEDGTGIVHIAPAFGEDDMKVGEKNKLPVLITVDEEGKMKKGIIGEGLFVKEADKIILEDLSRRNFLYQEEKIKHQYPFCWRCDSPLLYYPLSTWYVAVTKIKERLIKNNQKIHWVPAHIKEGRFGKWLVGARDWAFSRNRFWGTALPIWQCESCQKNIAVGSLKEFSEMAVSSGNKYFILRHGETEMNKQKLLSCWPEKQIFPLTEKGKKEIEKVGKILEKKNIQLIFSSDLLRTKETAEIVSRKIQVPIKFDERLREYNYGIFNGQAKERLYDFLGGSPHRTPNGFFKKPEGGETLREVQQRTMDFILELEKKYQNKNILIVSHGDPLWILQGAIQGFTENQIMENVGEYYLKLGEWREIKFWNLPRTEKGELNLHRPYIDKIVLRCSDCGGRARRVAEIFDCWFDSGAMPYAQWHYPFENKKLAEKTFPADFIAEGLDQTRGWFYTLHVLASALFNKPAFENVVVNGLILDTSGRKLSKKLRNYTEPEIIFEKYGADALRFFLLSSTPMGEDYQFSEKGVAETFNKVIDKFRNVFSFYQLYAAKKLKIKNLNVLDQWILARLNETIETMTGEMEVYEITEATRILGNFIDDLSNWYLRRSRKKLESLPVLNYIILETCKLMAPFAPFIAEAIYLELMGSSVHLEDWPKINSKFKIQNSKLIRDMAEIRRLASLVLAKRLEAGIKVRQPLQSLKIKNLKINKELSEILAEEVNVKEIIFDKKINEEIKLDIQITPELKTEGLLREVVRLVQGLRRDAHCQPQEKINLLIKTPEELKTILENKKDFLKKEINAREIKFEVSDKLDAEIKKISI